MFYFEFKNVTWYFDVIALNLGHARNLAKMNGAHVHIMILVNQMYFHLN